MKITGFMVLWWNGNNGYIGSTSEQQRLHRTAKAARLSMDPLFGEAREGDKHGRVIAKVEVHVPNGESYERYAMRPAAKPPVASGPGSANQ